MPIRRMIGGFGCAHNNVTIKAWRAFGRGDDRTQNYAYQTTDAEQTAEQTGGAGFAFG